MGDDSSRSLVKALKNEWSLFWEAINGEESEFGKADSEFEKMDPPTVMSLDQVRELTRKLVEDRKKLNQKLELISKEIDLNSAKLESLRLVGAEGVETLERIHELNDLGQNMAVALVNLDKKLREIREREDRINEELISP
jgi:hypothetical protein